MPNPADLAALEEALCLKDRLGATVTVLAIGPARLDVAYNPYTLLPGTLFKTDSSGALTKVQDGFSVDRRSRLFGVPLTVQFSVGQPF